MRKGQTAIAKKAFGALAYNNGQWQIPIAPREGREPCVCQEGPHDGRGI
jgi:hypothetical protein